jgi:hypothetical protein
MNETNVCIVVDFYVIKIHYCLKIVDMHMYDFIVIPNMYGANTTS